jgi:hypothetical protein
MNLFGNYGDITGNSDRLLEFTARLNRAYDRAATEIMSADGRWQWDDTNYTDLPIGSTPLVSGQQDYTMDVEHLAITKVLILDSSGNKYVINPIDENDPMGRVYLEDTTTSGGIPMFYDKKGTSLFLYPTPNYNKDAGLIVHYQRKPVYFGSDDTTQTPGVPFIFHRYLSLLASLDYAVSKTLAQKNDLAVLVKDMGTAIVDFYSKRAKDEAKFIRPIIRSSR